MILRWVNVESLVLNLRLFSFPAFPRKPFKALVLNFRVNYLLFLAYLDQCHALKKIQTCNRVNVIDLYIYIYIGSVNVIDFRIILWKNIFLIDNKLIAQSHILR